MATKNVDPSRDIWGALINESDSNKQTLSTGKHFLFVGGVKSGKTSLQCQFFSRREEPQPTIAISYQSSAIKHDEKEVQLHFWEIGSGTDLQNILDTIVSSNDIPNLSIFISFEIDNANSVLSAVDWAEIVQSRFNFKNQSTFFVGTFYDKFNDKDPSEKANTVQALRAIASKYHSGLIFTSMKDDSLCNRFRNLVRILAAGDAHPPENVTQHTSPVFIWPGTDQEAGGNEVISPFLRQMKTLQTGDANLGKEPALGAKFASAEIDDLLNQKERELDEKLRTLRANLNT